MKQSSMSLRGRRFERIVVLLDINVILRDGCKSCAAHVFTSVWNILEQCNEQSKSSTMWGYKLFDPCLTPSASRTRIGEFLGSTPLSEQFDAILSNLERFGRVLDLLVTTPRVYTRGQGSRAEYIRRTLSEMISEYSWDPFLATSDSSSSDEDRRKRSNPLGGRDGTNGDSNAIVLLSSVPTIWEDVSCFLNSPQLVVPRDEALAAVPALLKTEFGSVHEKLKSSNIQVCFLDVPRCEDLCCNARLQTVLNPALSRRLVLEGLSDLVRSFVALDFLILSPNHIPFKLLWNTMVDLGFSESGKQVEAHVRCKKHEQAILCELEIQSLDVLHALVSKDTNEVDMVLNSVLPKSSLKVRFTTKRFLVRQRKCPKTQLASSAFPAGQPAWPLLLLTLERENSVCEVRLHDYKHDQCCVAVLEPFSAHSGFLTVVEKESNTNMSGSIRMIFQQPRVDLKRSVSLIETTEEQSAAAEPGHQSKCGKSTANIAKHAGLTVLRSSKRQKVAKEAGRILQVGRILHPGEDCYRGDDEQPERVSWQEYFARLGIPSISSEVVTVMSMYSKGGVASEALQTMNTFLEEMKAEISSNVGSAGFHPGEESIAFMEVDMGPPACQGLTPATLQDWSMASVNSDLVLGRNIEVLIGDNGELRKSNEVLTVVDRKFRDYSKASVVVPFGGAPSDLEMALKEAKEYISSVERKIVDYLSSTDDDSQRFAGMLIAESQRCLRVIYSKSGSGESGSVTAEVSIKKKIPGHLKKHLLKSPKKLAAKYKDCGKSPSTTTVGAKLKEHELQILLRLEMISFDGGQLLEPPEEEQLVKDICKLLDSIQFHLDGGLFGGKSLLEYCKRLFSNRYKKTTIYKIFSIMELDPLASQPEKRFGSRLLARGVDVAASTLTQARKSKPGEKYELLKPLKVLDKSRALAKYSTVQGSEKTDLQAMLGHTSKKCVYQFAAGASNLRRLRKFKSGEMSNHSKPSKVPGKARVLASDDTVHIVCQTPVPAVSLMPHSCNGSDETCQPATLTPPMNFSACSPLEHEAERVEQSFLVVEATPFVRRRLTSCNVSKGNFSCSTSAFNERLAKVSQMSIAVLDIPAVRPSKIKPTSLEKESDEKPVLPRDLVRLQKGTACGSFSALLKSVDNVYSNVEGQKLKSSLGGHLFRNDDVDDDEDDDDDDDDEDGILSTPFKVNATNQSRLSFQSSHLEPPNCHKPFGLAGDENFANKCTGLPQFPAAKSISSPSTASTTTLPPANANGGSLVVLDTGMCRRVSREEPHLSRYDTTCGLGTDAQKGLNVHQKISGGDFLAADESCGTFTKELAELPAVVPRSPLGTIFVKTVHHAAIKQHTALELCAKLNTAASNSQIHNMGNEIASGPGLNKETICDVRQKRSSKSRAGDNKENESDIRQRRLSESLADSTSADASQRKTRSQMRLELTVN